MPREYAARARCCSEQEESSKKLSSSGILVESASFKPGDQLQILSSCAAVIHRTNSLGQVAEMPSGRQSPVREVLPADQQTPGVGSVMPTSILSSVDFPAPYCTHK